LGLDRLPDRQGHLDDVIDMDTPHLGVAALKSSFAKKTARTKYKSAGKTHIEAQSRPQKRIFFCILSINNIAFPKIREI